MANLAILSTEHYFLIAGIALFAIVLLQMSFWVGGSIGSHFAQKKQMNLNLLILEQKLAAAKLERNIVEGELGWSGYRTFRVVKLVREIKDIVSIYLTPQDQRPLPFFKPGQYLTFSLDLPGEKKPLIRCYSISNAPNDEFFRCTIKNLCVEANGQKTHTAKASQYLTTQLEEGQILRARAPAGKFHIDLNEEQPVVLLAGGIGITPIFSMLASIAKFQPHRRVILFYGGRSTRDYGLKNDLQNLVRKHRNIYLLNCFSDPLESDQQGVHYDVKGHVTIDLIKSMLPSNNFQYYLCGPGQFMSALVTGLAEWGVPKEQIHFEAFGPSSVKSVRADISSPEKSRQACRIRFTRTGETVEWNESNGSLLDAAEQYGVAVNSGCRAGNCGSCEVGLLKGRVRYSKDPSVFPESGKTLSCVACPDGDVEVDA